MQYYLTKKPTLPTMLSCLLFALGLLSFSVTGYADQSGLLFTVQADFDGGNPAFVVLDPALDFAVVESFELEAPAGEDPYYSIAYYSDDDSTIIALTERSLPWVSIITLGPETNKIEYQEFDVGGRPNSIAYADNQWFVAVSSAIHDSHIRAFDINTDRFTDINFNRFLPALISSSDEKFIWYAEGANLVATNPDIYQPGSVGLLDVETYGLVDASPLAQHPSALALNHDDSHLWVLDPLFDIVYKVDAMNTDFLDIEEMFLLEQTPGITARLSIAASEHHIYTVNALEASPSDGVSAYNITTEQTAQLAEGEMVSSLIMNDDSTIVTMMSQTNPYLLQFDTSTNERLPDITLDRMATALKGNWIGPNRDDDEQPSPIAPNPTLAELIVIIKAAIPNKISTGEGFTLASWLGEALSRLNQPRCDFIGTAHDFLMDSTISVSHADKTIWDENITDIYNWDCSDV